MIKPFRNRHGIQMYPNQKCIVTNKTVSNAQSPYGIFNVEATLSAAQQLSDKAFKLYAYMNLDQDGYMYALSPVAVFNQTGLSDKRYREAVKELIEAGYLVQSKKDKNRYTFYEYPEADCITAKVTPACGESAEISSPANIDAPPIPEGETVQDYKNTENATSNITGGKAKSPYPLDKSINDTDDSFGEGVEISSPANIDAPPIPEGETVQDYKNSENATSNITEEKAKSPYPLDKSINDTDDSFIEDDSLFPPKLSALIDDAVNHISFKLPPSCSSYSAARSHV